MTARVCAVTACGRTAGTVVCPRCRNQLVDALLDLVCGVTEEGERRPPSLLEALHDTIAGRTRLVDPNRPATRAPAGARGGVEPNVRAGRVLVRAHRLLTRWAQMFAESHPGIPVDYSTVEQAAEWLAGRPRELARWGWTPRCHREITSLVKSIRDTVDIPERWIIGVCSAPLPAEHDQTTETGEPVMRECPRHLYAGLDDETITCPACGTRHNVAYRRRILGDAVDDSLATVFELSRLLPNLLGEPVKIESLRKWARDELTPHPPFPGETARRYLVGEARPLIPKKATRHRARRSSRTVTGGM